MILAVDSQVDPGVVLLFRPDELGAEAGLFSADFMFLQMHQLWSFCRQAPPSAADAQPTLSITAWGDGELHITIPAVHSLSSPCCSP